MSALIAICGSEAVHLLTDAIRITADGKDIVTKADCEKQSILANGLVVAGIGFTGVGERFSQQARERAKSYDELLAIAPELFAEERKSYSPLATDLACLVVFAGWSEKHRRLKQCSVISQNADNAAFYPDSLVYAGGPTGCDEMALAFAKHFNVRPNEFDARRDGLPLIEKFRQRSGRVGGFVRHSIVTRAGVTSEIIHRWPSDRVGQPIEMPPGATLDATAPTEEGTADATLPAEVLDALRQADPALAAKYATPLPADD